MTCVCGSDALLRFGGRTYCAGCYAAGRKFGIENAEACKKLDDELEEIRRKIPDMEGI